MKQIFFNNRAIILCGDDIAALEDPESVIFYGKSQEDMKKAVETIDSNRNISRLYIPSDNIEATYNEIRTLFTEIYAAGGLVRNSEGKFLIIRRNGLWDLPKGKAEKNECPEDTAIREVMEECGIPKPHLRELICKTDHTYHLNGQFILKHTYWYSMDLTEYAEPVPQTEEGITKAVWISADKIGECASETHLSILEVLKSAYLISVT